MLELRLSKEFMPKAKIKDMKRFGFRKKSRLFSRFVIMTVPDDVQVEEAMNGQVYMLKQNGIYVGYVLDPKSPYGATITWNGDKGIPERIFKPTGVVA
jgi:hypothetical protein